jgi:hypothetical protein
MGTTRPAQVLDGAIDTQGVSILTAARDIDAPRVGVMYDPTSIAAVQPIHCHPLTPNRYLMVFSRRWYDATTDTADPGAYTAHTEDTTPGWVMLNTPVGSRAIVGDGYSIPLRTPAIDVTLTAACSRATEYLYLLASATVDGSPVGVVSHWWVNSTTGAIVEMAEEVVPSTISGIVFDRGLWYNPPSLVVIGADADHQVYMARKPWSRIGTNRVIAKAASDGVTENTGPELRWQYFDGAGWDLDPANLAPLTAADGSVITTHGPVDTATYKDRAFMSTVAADGVMRSAQVWTNRGDKTWRQIGTPVSLGSTSTDTYLGGTLQFQQQLAPIITATAMTDGTNLAVIPYVFSTKSVTGSAARLENTWGLFGVPR